MQDLTDGYMVAPPGAGQSTILVAEVETGVLVLDLGWTGAQEELARGLDALDRTPADVAAVLLTHAHRDHIAAWPLVADAPFYMHADDVDLFLGRTAPEGPLAELGHRLKPPPTPRPGEVEIRTFAGDTLLDFGRDTVRAFHVPGHTPGSTAYLFRGVLFVGDALSSEPLGGLRPAMAVFSDDPEQAERSMARLWTELEGLEVHYVCTAHARCVEYRQ